MFSIPILIELFSNMQNTQICKAYMKLNQLLGLHRLISTTCIVSQTFSSYQSMTGPLSCGSLPVCHVAHDTSVDHNLTTTRTHRITSDERQLYSECHRLQLQLTSDLPWLCLKKKKKKSKFSCNLRVNKMHLIMIH